MHARTNDVFSITFKQHMARTANHLANTATKIVTILIAKVVSDDVVADQIGPEIADAEF